MIYKNTPGSADLFPVGIEINANVLDDLRATLQYTHNVAKWLPPVLKLVLSRTFRDTIEFQAEAFNFLFPAAKGDHKVTLAGKLDDTGM